MKHIAITKQDINGAEVNSVLARDLYDSLGLDKSQFSRWSKKNIINNEFAHEDSDYVVVDIMSNGKNITDYALTLDFAKNISMMARSKEGEDARQYFLKVEKQYNDSMVNKLSSELHKMQALFTTQEVMGEVVTEHDKRITNLEKNRRMESWMEKNLLDAKNRKVYELANNDEKLAKKLHGLIWRGFKNKFNLPRYSELTAGRYEDGLMWLNNISLADVV